MRFRLLVLACTDEMTNPVQHCSIDDKHAPPLSSRTTHGELRFSRFNRHGNNQEARTYDDRHGCRPHAQPNDKDRCWDATLYQNAAYDVESPIDECIPHVFLDSWTCTKSSNPFHSNSSEIHRATRKEQIQKSFLRKHTFYFIIRVMVVSLALIHFLLLGIRTIQLLRGDIGHVEEVYTFYVYIVSVMLQRIPTFLLAALSAFIMIIRLHNKVVLISSMDLKMIIRLYNKVVLISSMDLKMIIRLHNKVVLISSMDLKMIIRLHNKVVLISSMDLKEGSTKQIFMKREESRTTSRIIALLEMNTMKKKIGDVIESRDLGV